MRRTCLYEKIKKARNATEKRTLKSGVFAFSFFSLKGLGLGKGDPENGPVQLGHSIPPTNPHHTTHPRPHLHHTLLNARVQVPVAALRHSVNSPIWQNTHPTQNKRQHVTGYPTKRHASTTRRRPHAPPSPPHPPPRPRLRALAPPRTWLPPDLPPRQDVQAAHLVNRHGPAGPATRPRAGKRHDDGGPDADAPLLQLGPAAGSGRWVVEDEGQSGWEGWGSWAWHASVG